MVAQNYFTTLLWATPYTVIHQFWHTFLGKHIRSGMLNNERNLFYFIFQQKFIYYKYVPCDFSCLHLTLNLHTSVQIARFINLHQILSIIQQNNNMQISDPHAIFFSFEHTNINRNEMTTCYIWRRRKKTPEPFFRYEFLFENSFMHYFYIAWENPFKSNLIRKLSQFSIKKIPLRIRGFSF